MRIGRLLDLATNPLRRQWLSLARGRRPGPRVLAISVPKSGTHLLSRCLDGLPGMTCFHRGVLWLPLRRFGPAGAARRSLGPMGGGTFASTHVPFSGELERELAEMGFAMLLLVRDPRDVAVSYTLFALRRRRHPQHSLYASLPDADTRLRVAIEGCPARGEPPRVLERFRAMLPWREHGAHLVRFENLVGEGGGGSRSAQRAEIAAIAAHLGIPATARDVEAVAGRVFSRRADTFRRGAIGDWRRHFTPAHAELFDRLAGPLLIDLGYEHDRHWHRTFERERN